MPFQYRIGNTALVISKVRKIDSGVYRCNVEANDGQIYDSLAELNVGGKYFRVGFFVLGKLVFKEHSLVLKFDRKRFSFFRLHSHF